MRQTKGMVSIQEDVTPEGCEPRSRPLVARTRGLADGTSSLASVECRVKTVEEASPP
jgi:hypothetical protein